MKNILLCNDSSSKSKMAPNCMVDPSVPRPEPNVSMGIIMASTLCHFASIFIPLNYLFSVCVILLTVQTNKTHCRHFSGISRGIKVQCWSRYETETTIIVFSEAYTTPSSIVWRKKSTCAFQTEIARHQISSKKHDFSTLCNNYMHQPPNNDCE